MGNISRYVVNAVGKGGETYYTHFQDKKELKKWLNDNMHKLDMNELKITDRNKNPFVKLFTGKA